MKKQHQKGWHQLTQEKRDRMEALLGAGETQEEIAKILKVDPGTISRERKRKRKNGRYEATRAQQKADTKRSHSKYQGMKVESNPALKAHVIRELKKKRSPDEIAGRMKRDKLPFYAGKGAIYKWLYSVYGQRYCHYLCTKRWKKKPQRKKTKKTMIPNRKSIEMRPRGATNKTRYGHFEADTAVAPKKAPNRNAVAVAAERKSKLLVGTKIPNLSPVSMTVGVTHMEQRVHMKSMTLDNGVENRNHEAWDTPAFFADPHSPWQKPLIESSIGLLRRWKFKKGTHWSRVSEEEFQRALLFLNSKYRKSLGYQSAIEVALAHGIMKKGRYSKDKKEIAIQ